MVRAVWIPFVFPAILEHHFTATIGEVRLFLPPSGAEGTNEQTITGEQIYIRHVM